MIRSLLILSSTFLLQNALAVDCTVTVGGKSQTIPDGSVKSLFDPKGNMENFKVQDQDGLGTCYANATTAVLKSVLPGQPDLSYHHAALKGSTMSDSQDWSKGGKYMKGKDVFLEGGWVCDTIKGMQKGGGACPAEFSLTENEEIQETWLQKDVYKGLAQYFDKMNSIKKNPKKLEKLRNDLTLVIETLKAKQAELIEKCEAETNAEYPVKSPLGDMLTTALFGMDTKKPCGAAIMKAAKALSTKDTVIKGDSYKGEVKQEVVDALEKELRDDPELAKQIKHHINGIKLTPKELEAAGLKMKEKIRKVFEKFVPAKTFAGKKCEGEGADYPLISPFYGGDSFINAQAAIKDRNCQEALTRTQLASGDFKKDVKKDKALSCIAPGTLEQLLAALQPLLAFKKTLDESLVDPLSSETVTFAQQMEKALMPNCLDPANLISMENVSCESHAMCDPGKGKSYDNSKYAGKKGGCLSMDSAKSIFQSEIISGIKENRALAVAVCTGFMKKSKTMTDFCQKKAEGIKGHGYHEMTISGYRCVGGKIEYQLTNSWGASCPQDVVTGEVIDFDAEPVYKNDVFDCELDKDKNPTGKFWVKEDSLVNNTTELTTVKNNP